MGAALERYVLPKVPDWVIRQGQRVEVVPVTSLDELGHGKGQKVFNWRRPTFVMSEEMVRCHVTPGTAYVLHYAHLVATAAMMRARDVVVTMAPPSPEEARDFIRQTMPHVPAADAAIVGYTERLHLGDADDHPWVMTPGWGWKLARVGRKRVLLVGCEFSFWGDVAGHVVAELLERQVSDWVIYVGKLGTLNAGVRPNRMLATGTESLVNAQPVQWQGRLAANLPANDVRIIRDARHVTINSVVEETIAWFDRYAPTHDLVDPEIGHMGLAAQEAGSSFDFLHLVTDCLATDYGIGLYDERSKRVISRRIKLMGKISEMIENCIIDS
jgi:hypothetical protein